MLKEMLYQNRDFSQLLVKEGQLDNRQFDHCSFANADFTDVLTLYGCKFENCSFASAAFNGVNVKNCVFLGCSFHYANLFATAFHDCRMTGSSFLHTDTSLLSIVGGDWSYTEMRYLEFGKQKLSQISFEGADLTGSRFIKCRIKDCVFSQATVEDVSFFGSDIRGSALADVDVLAIDLKNTIVDFAQCIAITEAIGAKYRE